MPKLVLDKGPRLVLDEPEKKKTGLPQFFPIEREKLPGVWASLDNVFSDKEELRNLLPLDVGYQFGRVVGMGTRPQEIEGKIGSAMYYSLELDMPFDTAFSLTDALNRMAFRKDLPADTAFGRIKQRYTGGKASVKSMDLAYDILGKTWQNWDEYDKQLKNLQALESQVPNDIGQEFRGFWEKSFGAATEQIPILLESLKAAPVPAGIGGLMGGIIAGIGSLAVPTVGEELPAVGAGIKTGIQIGAALGAADRIRQLEAGGMFLELARMKDTYGKRIDPKIAVVASHAVGAINGGIEIAEWGVLLSTFGIDTGIFSKAVESVTKKLAQEHTLKNIVARRVTQYGIVLGAETLQEIEQETSNVVFGELAKEINNRAKGTAFKKVSADDLKQRYKEVTTESLRSFGVILAPGVGISGAIEAIGLKKATKEKPVTVKQEKKRIVVEVPGTPEEAAKGKTEVAPGVFEKAVAPAAVSAPKETQPIAIPPVTTQILQTRTPQERRTAPVTGETPAQVGLPGPATEPVAGTAIPKPVQVIKRKKGSGGFFAEMADAAGTEKAKRRISERLAKGEDLLFGLEKGDIITDKNGGKWLFNGTDLDGLTESGERSGAILGVYKATRTSKTFEPNNEALQLASEATKAPVKLPAPEPAAVSAEAGAKVLYHGTTVTNAEKIQTKGFKPKIINGQFYGAGVYFSPSKDVASRYGKAVVEAIPNLKNPYVLDIDRYRSIEEWYDEIQDNIETPLKNEYGEAVTVHQTDLEGGKIAKLKPEATEAADAIRDYLQEQGFDGVIIKEGGETSEVVVFDPAQVQIQTPAAVSAEAGAKAEIKRIISKESYEAAKKRLIDRNTIRSGIDPQGLADLATIGAYHIESGLRTFGKWSKQMVNEFGDAVKPNLKRIWKDARKTVKLGDYNARKNVIKQIKTIQTKKGLSDTQYKEIKRKITETGQAKSASNMSVDELEKLLKKMQAARPRRIDGKKVITKKTENAVQSLKKSLTDKLAMTEEAFTELVQNEVGKRQPKYIDNSHFITETEGKAIIRRMHDVGEVLRVTYAKDKAVAESPEIGEAVKKIEDRISKKPKRDPWRVESMRYYAQQMQRVTGAPVYSMYQALIDAHNEIQKTRHARMTKFETIEGFKEIAGDDQALQRVSDYIASQSTLKDKPQAPANITESEKAVAKEIQKIFREYELKARVSKFFNWYYYGEGIAEYEQFKREIHKAEDIYDSQGKEALIEYLKTQTWGIVKSGYEPLENVIAKVYTYKMRPQTVGKGHVRVRTDIEYHKQERNILQRLNSYMRQMDLLYNMSPQINAFVRLVDDNSGKFQEPRKVTQSIETFLRNLKQYNIEGSWFGDILARVYAQVSQIVILSQPVLAFRNLFQNAAFEYDKSILFDLRNEALSEQDNAFRETHVQQLRGMMEEFFLINEKPLPIPFVPTLTKWLRHIKIYAWSDVSNRDWSFWAKMNQVRRAQQATSISDMMQRAKFEDMTLEEQVEALRILAADGKDAMARYIAKVHVEDIHFQYERSQRSPAEMDTLGRVLGNLMLFPRSYIELMMHAGNTLIDKTATPDAKYRAGKRIVAVMAGGYLTGTVYMMISGRKRNPYDPFQIFQVSPGGLVLGATQDLFEVGKLTIRALSGDKTAVYALTTAIPEMADDFIPFYDWTMRGLEASLDKKNIDREALREILAAIDKEYTVRKDAYTMKRNFVKKIQYVLSGPSVDNKDEGKKNYH